MNVKFVRNDYIIGNTYDDNVYNMKLIDDEWKWGLIDQMNFGGNMRISVYD